MNRLAVTLMVACAWAGVGATSSAGVIGSWDFSTGTLALQSGITGMQLQFLPTTPYYNAFGGTPNPPSLAFGTTDSFGIASLGGFTGQVMRMPDMRGRGSATGLMATFPVRANGALGPETAAANLNRYSLVMDVLVPTATFAQVAPAARDYLDLFQPRASGDGSLFINKVHGTLGAATSYSGTVAPDTWYRIAMVMNLDAATNAPRYQTYLNGSPLGQIIWDQIVVNNDRDRALKEEDLIPDGKWSLCPMSEMLPGYNLPSTLSSFFVFNDNNGELGELYVANLQFSDDALSAAAVAGLGGPAGGAIAVPEPDAAALAASAFGALLLMAGRRLSARGQRRKSRVVAPRGAD